MTMIGSQFVVVVDLGVGTVDAFCRAHSMAFLRSPCGSVDDIFKFEGKLSRLKFIQV